MAAPLVIQESAFTNSTTSVMTLLIEDVTPGSTLILKLGHTAAAVRTYAVTDNVDAEAWVQAAYNNTSRGAGIWYHANSSGGDVTVEITQSSTHSTYYFTVSEAEPCTLDVASSSSSESNVATHYCAAPSELDTDDNVLVFSAGVLRGSGTELTENGDFTLVDKLANLLFQYRRSDTALTEERCEFTSSTARQNDCVSASFATVVEADITAPTVVSATIDAAGTTLTVVFDEPVTGNTGLTITPTGGAAGLTYSSGVTTDTLVYSIDRVILSTANETVTRSYTPGNITDIATNALGSFSAVAVTNNSTQVPDVTAPTLSTATLTGATSLVLVFDEAVTLTDETGMTIAASGAAVTVTGVSGDTTDTLTLTLSRPVASTESLSFSYDSGTGDVTDIATNALASISNRLVTNNLTSSGGSSLIGSGLIQ